MRDEFLIIDSKYSNRQVGMINNAAVVLNMYYQESYERYIGRIGEISEIIKVYLISSSQNILDRAKKYVSENDLRNIELVKKENRGRDISALLVAARDIVKDYKYICFCHDKASKNEHTREFAKDWEATLFDNTIFRAC